MTKHCGYPPDHAEHEYGSELGSHTCPGGPAPHRGEVMSIMAVEVDCHAYPWHEPNPEYPECGPDNLVRMSEEYGVLVTYLGHPWGWWYEIKGPRDHIIRLLLAEYCGGDVAMAEEILEGSEVDVD